MKKNIHPQWYPDAVVKCACGNTFTVGATKPQIEVEICAACHPFFTGAMKYVDIHGRVERFMAKQKTAQTTAQKKKKEKEEKEKRVRPESLREMLHLKS